MLGQHGAECNAHRACQRKQQTRPFLETGVEPVADVEPDSAADKAGLLEDDAPPEVRQLTEDDRTAFAEFQAAASAADLDAAFVELDHWAAFGAFEQGHLVCAASAYPWGGARIADIGVLSLAPFRGRGHARNVVRSLSRYALAQGYEPQYRCQLDNQASVALAGAAGLSLFGTWDVVASESAD